MRFAWLLVGCMSVMAKVASNVLEVDLVFPRNDTYAPADLFPIVFAFQNPERARLLNPDIFYTIRDWDNMFGNNSFGITWSHDLKWANWSSHDPYFVYTFFPESFRREGHYWLTWSIGWNSCDMNAFSNHGGGDIVKNDSTWSVLFTIKDSAQKVDLVAATANKTCPKELGTAINVTGQMTLRNGNTCAVVASSTPTPTPDPCQVKIDSAIVASMSASQHATFCKGLHPPADCPEEDKSAAQQLMVIGVSCFLAAVGAIGFILM
ncbi:uncharacterized protein KD926_008603 [Aspergillus affinis]|uniref:uncharacterized protein n=1 Tax=Aspergillus affinis TaxID=1070780 RepID=UPI0022FDBD52|nr:uncharacterized protein KD926_008603 [Aspergillus affinis]KAI9040040.1 hypothetical protein KD926_008603 [Aspergillus affinis]